MCVRECVRVCVRACATLDDRAACWEKSLLVPYFQNSRPSIRHCTNAHACARVLLCYCSESWLLSLGNDGTDCLPVAFSGRFPAHSVCCDTLSLIVIFRTTDGDLINQSDNLLFRWLFRNRRKKKTLDSF